MPAPTTMPTPMKRGLRLFGHPVHPMLVHLPMGLLLTAPLWDLLALLRGGAVWWAISFWTMALGCLGGLAAAVAGVIDFAALPAEHPASGAANAHLYLILGAISAFGGSLLVRRGQTLPAGHVALTVGLDVAGFLLLVAGGYFGAEMVYRHGVGQESTATGERPAGYHS